MALLIDTAAFHRQPAGVVSVAGADRLTYLQSLLSQDVAAREPGEVADFLYLDAKGNAKALGRLVVRVEDVLLVTHPGVAPSLADELSRYTFLLDAPSEDRSAAFDRAVVRGPEPVSAEAIDAPEAPMTARVHGEGGVGHDGVVLRDRSGGLDLLGPPEWVERTLAALGLPEADAADWERWRITAGEPVWGSEVTPGHRTQELGLLPTHVHLDKGCYPGQESIAKTYNLGRPRRALCVVAFDGTVSAGDAVDAGEKRGEITSAAPTESGTVALALVPVDRDGSLRGAGTVTSGEVAGQVLHRVGEHAEIPGAERQPGSRR